MALNSVKDGYNILATSGKRPNLVSLDGWAGFQRYAGYGLETRQVGIGNISVSIFLHI
ncbi:MAG: hypothetical protein ACLR43_10425 [Faecalibacillus faecis]